jgi:hypothetical protein
MKKEQLVKSLALGIIVLFIGTGIVSGSKITDKSNVTNDNHPPEKPIIKGPTKIMGPWTYNWTFNATDSDSDNVSYQIDWGDGTITNWTDWYPSGVEITRSHSYIIKTPHPIKARAKDTYGAIGDWGEIMFDYSISEQITNPIFFKCFSDIRIYKISLYADLILNLNFINHPK